MGVALLEPSAYGRARNDGHQNIVGNQQMAADLAGFLKSRYVK